MQAPTISLVGVAVAMGIVASPAVAATPGWRTAAALPRHLQRPHVVTGAHGTIYVVGKVHTRSGGTRRAAHRIQLTREIEQIDPTLQALAAAIAPDLLVTEASVPSAPLSCSSQASAAADERGVVRAAQAPGKATLIDPGLLPRIIFPEHSFVQGVAGNAVSAGA